MDVKKQKEKGSKTMRSAGKKGSLEEKHEV